MKHLLIATGLAVGLAMSPAMAEDQDAAKQEANNPEALHAPTNRVGEMVPTMSSSENKDDAAAGGDKKAEELHAPTNRVGDEVPTMRSEENPDG